MRVSKEEETFFAMHKFNREMIRTQREDKKFCDQLSMWTIIVIVDTLTASFMFELNSSVKLID